LFEVKKKKVYKAMFLPLIPIKASNFIHFELKWNMSKILILQESF